jgi:hypothetical protein
MGLNLALITEQVEIGGHAFTVAALPLGAIQRLFPLIEIADMEGIALKPEVMDGILQIVHLSLSKADPGIALEDLRDNLLVDDLGTLIAAIGRVSGLKRIAAGEAQRPESLPSSGGTSTGISQSAQDGRSLTSSGS